MAIAVETLGDGALPTTALAFTPTVVTPTTGQTVVMAADNYDRLLWLTPAGTLDTLTVTLPADATSRVGQQVMVGASQVITALTVNGATTIHNPPTSLALGGLVLLVKVASSTWATLS